MQNIVAKAVAVAVVAVAATTTSMVLFDKVATARAVAATYSTAERPADAFSSQPSVVLDVMGGRDAIAAAENAGVMLTIFGLGGIAIMGRMRWQAETVAVRARQRAYR